VKKKYTDKVYRQRAAKLSKYGFAAKANKRIKPSQKAQITKLWKKAKFYITNQDRNRIEFVRVKSKSGLKTARSVLSNAQLTPKGFFLQRPKGMKKGSLRYIMHDGSLEIVARKRMHDVIIPLNLRLVITDPKRAQQDALGKRKSPRQMRLMVNGFAGKTSYGVADFFNYMHDELPKIQKKSKLTRAEMEDIFHLRLIY
jgi:hypothetical protein